MSKFNILFKVSSSIASYKAVQVVSDLVKLGHNIKVLCSPASLNFVGLSTWQGLSHNEVYVDQYRNSQKIDHIELDRWADGIVLCPASASRLNSMAAGVSSDLLNDTFLAHDFKKPYIVFPAMNSAMLAHPATQSSIEKLKSWGLVVEDTAKGLLACGEVGAGKLTEPSIIVNKVLNQIARAKNKATKRVLISAGGTSENIDTVRKITNLSRGYTGSQIAQELYREGHDVDLITSSTAPRVPEIESHIFTDHRSLEQSFKSLTQARKYDWIIHAAAVSDFKVDSILSDGKTLDTSNKINSKSNLRIELTPTTKIIEGLSKYTNNTAKIIAFKLTSGADQKDQIEAVRKLVNFSGVELVVHNEATQFLNSTDSHIFTVYDKSLNKLSMVDGANELANLISTLITQKREEKYSQGANHDFMS